ncbi:transposase [Acidiferrobacter sp. SPIII_3]|uniref:IS1634 family transposase n=1 Tax=Acidiferrobacter sp. SPIII_3 TaxID=1281578 RepID=UPI000D7331DD|nr:IS1634 family transposase [Acidiferrobacter sp. SPIII_3]AWP23868.1 transposase [Acidiferrobacter sp. SPIII_3]
MHIHIVPNRGSTPTILLRESYREGKKVKKRTLANLSHLPMAQVALIRAVLSGADLQVAGSGFVVTRSQAHGHVDAVAAMMQRLGLPTLISGKPCRERDIVFALIASRILAPHTKLATTRWWHSTTVVDIFGVADVDEQDCYAAMDWLLARQDRIQKKLAARHLTEGGLVLYDLSSSYFEGHTCPLAKRGYSRDGKHGTLQVEYGLMTDGRGCPVAISVHEGNVADPTTLMPEIQRLKTDFGIEQFVMVGDRGMISQKAIDAIREQDGIDWITALRGVSIRALVEDKTLQPDLFDERNLLDLSHPDYPGERLVACRNPELRKLRGHKREDLLVATEESLRKIQIRVEAGRLTGRDHIGLKVGQIVNRYKMAKHFTLDIQDTAFSFARKTEAITAEAALDGLYIIRTSVVDERMDAATCVRHYKSLAQVERAFRSLKTMDLKIRPIHHRLADRVKAHIFLCMLAYYVEWHMRAAWRELMFTDEDQKAKETRDPVAPAQRSRAAKRKASRHQQDDGTPVHSFQTLLADLATIVCNTCRTSAEDDAPTFTVTTQPTPLQQRAMELIATFPV